MKTHSLIKRGAIALLLLLALTLPLTAAASETPVPQNTVAGDTVSAPGGEDVTAPVSTPPGAPAEEEGSHAAPGEGSDYTPLSATVAAFLSENAAGILSAATFLFTLIVTLVFRRRVMPSLLTTLAGLIGKSRETLEATASLKNAEREWIHEILSGSEEAVLFAKTAAQQAEAAADAMTSGETGREALALILREQSSLLYELLMSANLPQYQKDRIGAAHARTEAALGEAAHD